jgi:hypothetical protein
VRGRDAARLSLATACERSSAGVGGEVGLDAAFEVYSPVGEPDMLAIVLNVEARSRVVHLALNPVHGDINTI